ncbi:hypothetical protein GCM10010377_61500 [Streptomyces viridiviolaceus]|nr:hypothetical protein GCM10010377_61500 [Streptomyces viridiviolaceus]
MDPGGERASQSRPAQPPDGPSTGRGASAQPSVPAADGRDVAACTDGTCEVAVSAPVTIRFRGPGGPATLSVTGIGPNRVEYTVESGNGRSRASTNGPGQGCITVLRRNGGGNSCGRLGAAGPSPGPDAVVIQAAAGEDGTAVLHIVSE